MSGGRDDPLREDHRAFLADRAIAPGVIAARGYSTTGLSRWLIEQGFPRPAAARVPGFVIPIRDVKGKLRFHQYHPDHPRTLDGRIAKYEVPHWQPGTDRRLRLVLDVPPGSLPRLRDARWPLYVCESPLKADAAVSAGLAAVGVFGVWGWRQGVALPDWDEIMLDGREIYLCPDSDVRTNDKVAQAIGRLGRVLAIRGGNVRYVYLPHQAGQPKVGLDDWLHGPSHNPADLAEYMADEEAPDEGGRVAVRRAAEAAAGHEEDEPELTDAGYALRLLATHAHEIRYVGTWGEWRIWDGQRWAADRTGRVYDWAVTIARDVTAAALKVWQADSGSADKRQRFHVALAHERAAAIKGSVEIASKDRRVAITHDDLDRDPELCNTPSGTSHLPTGELRPHDPADLITKITRVPYIPGATSELWDDFLAKVQPAPEMREFLAQLSGHALEGRVAEHILAVHYGDGENGKSTYLETIVWALGDYAAPGDPELLTARTLSAHPVGAADLFGLRFVLLHETDEGKRLAEATLKRLTGGDAIKARRMRENFWPFEPTHSLVMMTNHKPVISGTDRGIWRRLKLVPWDVRITAAERDLGLKDRLRAEAGAAVLAHLVAGYRAWREAGKLAYPETVRAATERWHDESDALGRFIDQRCLTYASGHVRSADLFAAWLSWCAAENVEAGTQTAFSLALEKVGYSRRRASVGTVWDGLQLEDK